MRTKTKGYGPNGAFTATAWANMNEKERNRACQADWYRRKKKQRNKERREKYAKDEAHRKKVLADAKTRRAASRKETADEKFEALVKHYQEKSEPQPLDGPGRRCLPRHVRLSNGWSGKVYPTSYLSWQIGRSQETVAMWMSEKVLPGSSIEIAGRYFFSYEFIDAVELACRKLYRLSGDGRRMILRDLIAEELKNAKVSWLPFRATEDQRVSH